MVKDKLTALVHVATMISDAELANLKEKETLRQKLAAARASLMDQRASVRSNDAATGFDTNAADRWMDWSGEQLRQAAIAEANAAAKAEEQKRIAARAFARANVLAKLVAKQDADRPPP